MKQNVTTNILFTLTDTATATLLYIVFPIIPFYVFITLLALIITSSALKRYGLTTAILVTYVVLTFITALGHASLLIMPLLLTTYLITEAGVINDIAIVSWALLFTPLYWLSIPLSIAPSIKGYSVRSAVIFSLLTLLYVIGVAYQGITWTPIMVIHVTNLNLVRGMESLIFDGSGNLLTIYSELSNVMLYFVFIIIMTIPPLISRYLPRLTIIWPMSRDISQIIMNLVPQLITVSLLYIPLINDLWNYYITPLLVVGSLIIGFSTYALDIAQSRLKVVTQSVLRTRKRSPIVIPIIDPLMITEYGYWIKKLPKDYVDLANTIVNILSKTGVVALHASLPQDKVEIIAKALFGLTRAKGFIIKGDINELTNDVNWFIRTHEKALLVLIPNEINKDMILSLIDYNKRMKLYALIINNGNNDVISKLRKYGIEVITYGETENTEINQKQTKNVEETQLKQGNMTETVINTNALNNNPTPINEEPIQTSNAPINMEITTTPARVVNEKSVNRNNEVATNLQLEKGITKEEKALEGPKPSIRKEKTKGETTREKPRARGKNVNANVVITLDPVDLISMNTKSKLIDYIDSSIRLRDMMSNLGLKYITSILVVGPPKSGKTALINYVAKHLGVAIIDYKDPSISIIDNAIVHVPNFEGAINEDLNHVLKLLNIARAKHLVIVFESSNPWSVDPDFIRKNVDAVIPILPIYDDYINEVIEGKLRVNDKDKEVIKGIIKSCPAVEAIEKIKLYLSSRDGTSIICEDTFRKYQDFAQSISV
ncbi:hypothetical protein [Vulcanisaeta distributa]|uniref:hypothetical protein n=1 Tax=Vulcanisaeta distributa TaxID=164451 RepID=UPI0011E4FFF5|nr:hypothetical protein [Vulcanisaeta distributa]